jgi:2-hydroxy-6-oxonona-2,4-dienedioate hydrolase
MPDSEIEVNGGIVVYEFVGPEDGEIVVITPGGRFSKDYGGVHELADALAAGGKRVLLWDRPNCGRSEVQVYGRSESHMRAETLGLMLQQLGVEQVVATGGSGGARDMIIFTIMWPDLVRKLAVWSIVGGTYSTMLLATAYVLDELGAVRKKGIEGVIEMDSGSFSWSALVAANPRNRDRLLALGSEEFERVMNRWLDAFIPKPNEAIPGVPDWEFGTITCPTLIVRGGEMDYDHPKRTSFEVHALIKGSRLIEPPWPEDAWERGSEARAAGTGDLFGFWVLGAPALLDFMNEP